LSLRTIGILGSFAALLTAGCDKGDSLAGSSSETENVLSARLFRVDSLLPAWNHPKTVSTVATLRLDSSLIPFDSTLDNGGDLSVERIDSQPIPFRIAFWDKSARLGRVEVRLEPDLLAHGSKFRFRWARPPVPRSDSATVWRAIPDSQHRALTSTLVDDFEHEGLQSALPRSGTWYTLAGDSGTATTPDIAPAGRGRGGRALHFSYMGEKGWVYGGVPVADGGPRNLRTLDSIVLWVRGPVKLAIGLDQRDVGKAWIHHMIDSNWTRLSIRPQDFETIAAGGNIGWLGVRDAVTDLVFFVSQGSDIWLDDIHLHGVSREDLD
jgi:hypothetical protein